MSFTGKNKGWFAVGVEGLSKPMNYGAVMRTAHAFGASFIFMIGAHHRVLEVHRADTSKTDEAVPCFEFDSVEAMRLPGKASLVGVELTANAVDLPTFRHPKAAAYVLGREKGSLSPEMLARCDHVVKIPTRFCVNVSIAAALTLYDRTLVMGGWPDRPVKVGGVEIPQPEGWTRPGRAEA